MGKYINLRDYLDPRFPFQFFVGGRGVGKSYSALGLIEDHCILWMRRTDDELNLLNNTKQGEGVNPYKKYNKNNGTNYCFSQIKDHISGIYTQTYNDDNEKMELDTLRGYGGALSTLSKVRGIDLSDVTIMAYDEFIPETHVRKMAGEATALFNCYETVNRNREMEGEPPVYFIGMANAFDIACPIFMELGIVSELEKCIAKGKSTYEDVERGLRVVLLETPEEFEEEKKQTALYKLTAGTTYYNMALSNDFSYNDFSLIKHVNLKGWRPVCSINKRYYIYRSKDGRLHVSYMTAQCTDYNIEHRQELTKLKRNLASIVQELFMRGKITFESYEVKKAIVDNLIN